MGIGKRVIGIICGLLLCIVLVVVLNKGKQVEKPKEDVVQEALAPTPFLTEIPTPVASQEPEKTKPPTETEVPIEETDTHLPPETSAPLPTPKPTAIPTPKETPIPKETPTPLPAITDTPSPVIAATPLPVITNTSAPSATPVPEVTDKKEEEHVHQFEKSVWELPTCEKGGYYNNVCKECGVVECVTQDPIPHEVEDLVIQEGNCMEDRVIQHICKMCEQPVKSDTRYTVYDKHSWTTELIDGVEAEYCAWCGITK